MSRNLFLLTLTWASLSFAQVGLIESYRTSLNQQAEKFKALGLSSSPISSLAAIDIDKLHLNQQFLQTILLYSPKKYLTLGSLDSCGLYDLILAGILRDTSSRIETFYFDYQDKTLAIPRPTLVRDYIAKKCPKSLQLAKYFKPSTLASTVKNLDFSNPKGQAQCEAMLQKVKKEPKTAFLCGLHENIVEIGTIEKQLALGQGKMKTLKSRLKDLKSIKAKIPLWERSYISNLCENLENEENFCEFFLTDNFYSKILHGKVDSIYAQDLCLELFTSDQGKNLNACISQLIKQPNLCLGGQSSQFTLLPKDNCDFNSLALNNSKLKANYRDCPALVNNETIIGISRLLRHFSYADYQEQGCQSATNALYAHYNLEKNGPGFWDTKLCYYDRIEKEELCHPTIFGESKFSKLSVGKNVEKILPKLLGLSGPPSCKVIPQKNYRPVLLEFQNRCFVLLPDETCQENCEPKVVYNTDVVQGLNFKQDFKANYFANSFQGENNSQVKLLVKNLKLKSVPIVNGFKLVELLKEHEKALVHGVACSERLYPRIFSTRTLNQCTPTTFIIDGYIEKNKYVSVVLRSSLDSVHAPRLISWRRVFDGIKAYQMSHPLNRWSLYALYP